MTKKSSVWVKTDGGAYIPFRQVPQLPYMPPRRGGADLAVETVHRWATAGVRGHRLKFDCVGGVRCTTEIWLREFFRELAGRSEAVTEGPRANLRRQDAVAREMEREGI